MDISCVRLSSGEELIGEVVNKTHDLITINAPIMIMMVQSPQGGFSFALAPFMPYLEGKDIVLNRVDIQILAKPNNELMTQYATATGKTVIIQPSTKIIQP